METKELAKVAQQFMARVQLSGNEVPAYVAVMDWLESLAIEEPPAGKQE